MRPCLVRLALSMASLLAVGAPAWAQDAIDRFLDRPITAVRLQIEGRPESSSALMALVDVQVGDRLSVEGLRRVVDRISRVPRFENVRVLAGDFEDGVAVTFDLEPRHAIDRVEFEGETGLDSPTLERLVRDQFGGVPSATSLGDVEDAVKRMLRYEGYRSATTTAATVKTHDPDRATLVVNVVAGPRSIIRTVEVRGESPLSRQEVLARAQADVGSPFRERDLSIRMTEIRDELRLKEFYAAIAQPTFTATGADVDLVLTVDAGPRVTLIVQGELPRGGVDQFIPIRRQGSIDPDLLDDARGAIADALRREGYWKAAVTYTQTRPAPNQLVLTFTIDRGPRYRITRIALPESLQIPRDVIDERLGLKPGDWFSAAGVVSGLLALKADYHYRGFHQVVMDPQYEEVEGLRPGEGGVVITPNITEGVRAVVARITFDLGEQPVVTESDLRAVMQSRPGGPYVPAIPLIDQDAIRAYYERRGFLDHAVRIVRTFNEAATEATLAVTAREGPRVLVGEITVVGNERIGTDVILRDITLRPGQPYSEEARAESQRRLLDSTSYRTVRIALEPRLPGEAEQRLLISVEETPATAIGYGGGLEGGTRARSVEGGGIDDRVEFAPRAFFEIGRRNLGGRNRTINLFSRISLKKRDAPDDPANDGRGFGFSEYRVSGTYRERYAVRTETDLLLGVTSEQAIRTTFNCIRRVANAEILHLVTPRMRVSGRYAVELTRLFDERIPADQQSLIDRLFPQVRLSMLSSGVFWDRRNDQISPSRGSLVSASADFALRSIGSEVGFVKSFVTAAYFRPIAPAPRRVVFATRAQLGLARGFERIVPLVDDRGNPILDPDGQPEVQVVADLPASQRFFAGGSSSVRGFQLDRLGVPEILNPNGLSDGGNGLVVLNAELRAVVGQLFSRDFAVVGFVDGGNVFDRASEIDLGRLRGAVGFGVRYDSPLGPLRLDFGFKTSRLQFATRRERGWEFHLSIGEVF